MRVLAGLVLWHHHALCCITYPFRSFLGFLKISFFSWLPEEFATWIQVTYPGHVSRLKAESNVHHRQDPSL